MHKDDTNLRLRYFFEERSIQFLIILVCHTMYFMLDVAHINQIL